MKYIFKVDRSIPCAYNAKGDKGYSVWFLPISDHDISGFTIWRKGDIDGTFEHGSEYELNLELKPKPVAVPDPSPEPPAPPKQEEPMKEEAEFDPPGAVPPAEYDPWDN